MSSPTPAFRLEMRDIAKRFGATVALDGVSLRVAAGEVLALVGENGAGKSTLMKVLSGAHTPDAGQMWLEGQPFLPAHPLEARRAGVAMIYQELSLAPHLTVEENILLGLEPSRFGWIDRRAVRAKATTALRQFGHAEIRPDRRVKDLTVGAQQLVEIARALAVGCRMLVLDEPTSSLTSQDVRRLFDLIGQLKQQGLAIVYISHFLEEVKEVSDRITVLRDGRSVGEGRTAEMSIDQIVALMVGREVKDLYPRSARTPGETILELAGLAGAEKPAAASLALRRGEVLGIAGLMGAGRTELLRCIFGLNAVRRGTIKVGVHLGPASPVRRWEQGVGLLSEDRKQEGLALSLSVADNVTLSRLRGLGPAGLISPRRQAEATRRWIGRLDIRCRGPEQAVGALSGGNQQKVALARLLQHNVDVLLLDEPTRGIDVAAKATLYRIIDELAAGGAGGPPKAVLIVSSYLPELMGICDRIAVMCRGQLGPAHPVGEVNEHVLMREATGQEALV
jgi:ribose transport system ATP-binding protein